MNGVTTLNEISRKGKIVDKKALIDHCKLLGIPVKDDKVNKVVLEALKLEPVLVEAILKLGVEGKPS